MGAQMMTRSADLTSIFHGGFVAMSQEDVNSFNAAQEFENAMLEKGLVIKHGIDCSGKIVRVPTLSKPKNKNGWYVFYPEGVPAGAFGDYESGFTQTYCAQTKGRALSITEQMENRKRMEDAKRQREEERQRKAEDAIEIAISVLEKSSPAPEDHPYIQRKGIKLTPGVRMNGDGELLIPQINESGDLCSIQRIYPDGDKKNWYNLPKGMYIIPGSTASVYVCEGWATGATLHEATSAQVYVAFDTGNLKRTAEYARRQNPTSRLIMAADNDKWNSNGKNPGVEFAQAAAAVVGGQVIIPDCEGISGKPTDWNDIHVALGIAEVRSRLSIEVSTVKRQFELVRIDTVEITEIDWVVDGYLEADALSLIFGEPGKGKSFVAIDMALCVATGKDWHGQQVKQGAVIYIAGEGHSGFARRARAWSIANEVDLKGVPFFKSRRSCQLFDVASAHEVADAVRDICTEQGVHPTLIVVDTVARNMGGDENSTPDMARFVEHIDALLRIPYKSNVLLVHHSGKASPGQARGSTVLRGALDQEYMVDMDDSTKMITLANKKMKDGEVPLERRFSIKQVGLGVHGKDGLEIMGAALETVDISAVIGKAKEANDYLGKNQRKAFKAVQSLEYSRRKEGSSVPITVDDWREASIDAGVPRNRFHEAKEALVAKGSITISASGIVSIASETGRKASESDEIGRPN